MNARLQKQMYVHMMHTCALYLYMMMMSVCMYVCMYVADRVDVEQVVVCGAV